MLGLCSPGNVALLSYLSLCHSFTVSCFLQAHIDASLAVFVFKQGYECLLVLLHRIAMGVRHFSPCEVGTHRETWERDFGQNDRLSSRTSSWKEVGMNKRMLFRKEQASEQDSLREWPPGTALDKGKTSEPGSY